MASFLRPANAEVASDFDKWFEDQLERHWSEGFGRGVLVLPIPEKLFVFPYALIYYLH
jgi:hypothetical protein